MRVEIHYCPVWSGYDVEAARVAAEVQAAGVDAVVIAGAQSQFDVSLEGERIFSKRLTGRFPAPGEVADLIATRSS